MQYSSMPMNMNNMNMANFGIQNQNMMMNNENLCLYNNNLENNINDDEIWNLIFKTQYEDKYLIKISKNRKIEEAIKMYKMQSNTINRYQAFIFNGSKLNPNQKICESGLRSFCHILVLESEELKG